MPLTSLRFASNARLQAAALNRPAMGRGERGPAVALVQQALLDLGYPMPRSAGNGVPDGVYGRETKDVIWQFQQIWHLSTDGVAGKQTLEKLDSLFPGNAAPPAIFYMVPGLISVLSQRTSLICWATVHCMMRSWREQRSLDVRGAAAAVEEKYGVMVDANQALPGTEFRPFIRKAGMQLEQMASYPLSTWVSWLQTHGLLWCGTLNLDSSGRHSRIVEGVSGTGQANTTYFHIIDPDGGRRYLEPFSLFLQRYENAVGTDEYYQIRHF